MQDKYVFLKALQRIFGSAVYLLPHLDSILQELVSNETLPTLDGVLGPDQRQSFEKLLKEEREKVIRDQHLGFGLVHWGHPEYPSAFYRLIDFPLTFMYKGAPFWMDSPCLSIVGSREPHPLSVAWMKNELPEVLKKQDLVVASGGARGIDTWAHRLALQGGHKTLVFVPSGLKKIYPSTLADMSEEWVRHGATFISEYDSDFEIRKHLFQHRNRLIAAIGLGTLIVEARKKSGTLMTAHMSLSLGRPTWIVPGHPQMPAFRGSLDLLLEGAQCLCEGQDLLLFLREELEDTIRAQNLVPDFKKVKKSEKSL